MKFICSCICLLLCTWTFATAGETISLGNIPLLPNTAGQTFTVSVSGGEQTAGMDLYLQIGGGTSGPTITAVNMTTAATIWTAAGIQTPYPGGDSRTALNGVVTASGTVAANGAIAVVTVNTTGISSGTFPISLSVSGSPTDILDNGGTSLALVLVDGTVTVNPATYAVTYDANGASSGTAPAAQTKTQGVSLTLATNSGTLALTGSTFAGWNTQANGLGTDYAAGANYTSDAAVVLYAKWTATAASTYAYDGFAGGTVNNGGTGWAGDWSSGLAGGSNLAYSNLQTSGAGASVSYYGSGQATRTLTSALAGTVWFSWIQDATATVGDANQIRFMNSGAVKFMIGQHFDAATIKIYSDGDGAVVGNTALTTLGTNFLAVSVDLATGALNLYVNPTGLGSGSVPTSPVSATATLGAIGINQLQTVGNGSAYTVDEIRVGSSWLSVSPTTATTYAVTYNANGASSGTVPAAQTKTQGVALTLATNSGTLALTGSTFIGWNTQANGLGTDYAAGASYTANAAVVLYAKWTTLPTFTVTYAGNGSTGGSVPVDGAAYLTGANVTVLGVGSLVKAGNSFAGWNTVANGSGTAHATATILVMGSANVTLYAQWTPASGSTAVVVTNGSGGGGCGSGALFGLLIACCSWLGLSRRRQHAA